MTETTNTNITYVVVIYNQILLCVVMHVHIMLYYLLYILAVIKNTIMTTIPLIHLCICMCSAGPGVTGDICLVGWCLGGA